MTRHERQLRALRALLFILIGACVVGALTSTPLIDGWTLTLVLALVALVLVTA